MSCHICGSLDHEATTGGCPKAPNPSYILPNKVLHLPGSHGETIERLRQELQAFHTLTSELNDQIVRLQHDNRVLNEQINQGIKERDKFESLYSEAAEAGMALGVKYAEVQAELTQAKERLAAGSPISVEFGYRCCEKGMNL